MIEAIRSHGKRPSAVFGWGLVFFCLSLAACNEDVCVDCPCGECPPPESPYHLATAPESLVANLQLSYQRREIEEYAKLLAPEFKFELQPIDAAVLGTEYWTRDWDSTGTRALFTTPEVSEIRLSLAYSPRDTTINFPGTPVDSVRIRIATTDLQVDQTDGITWVVTDQQDMYFRKGKPENGENKNYWLLYEWDDLPTLNAGGIWGQLSPQAARPATWGNLKARYGN